jgi:hypothetical protein
VSTSESIPAPSTTNSACWRETRPSTARLHARPDAVDAVTAATRRRARVIDAPAVAVREGSSSSRIFAPRFVPRLVASRIEAKTPVAASFPPSREYARARRSASSCALPVADVPGSTPTSSENAIAASTIPNARSSSARVRRFDGM